MARCALCDEKFVSTNNSREHVIAQAIGGRKKVKGFLCKDCNSRCGHTWDTELAEQLNCLSLFFAVDRQCGATPPQKFDTVGGRSVVLTENGIRLPKPDWKVTITEGLVNIQIQANNRREMRQALTGLKRQYPSIDVEHSLNKVVEHRAYLDDMIRLGMQFGGLGSGRSVVKSAFALASDAGVWPAACEEARRYLESGEDPCFGFYYTRDLIQNRPPKTVLHCVAVKSTSDGLLLGYVELFSIYKMVICLSKAYTGPNVSESHALDPHTRQKFNLDVDLAFSLEDIEDIKAYKHYTAAGMEQVLHLAIPVGLQRSTDREWKSVVPQALNYAWDNCGARVGDTLTHEHIATLSRLFAERVTPMVMHLRRKGLQPSPGLLGLDSPPTRI